MQQTTSSVKDSAIIYSGGLDSTTLLYEEQQRIALAITFDYGSNHAQREIACARHHCRQLGIEHLVVDLSFFKGNILSSLTAGADAIPDGNYNDENMKSTVVPFRNGIMLAIACGIAESNGLKRVMIANHAGDHSIYPDCRSPFIDAMSTAMQTGTYEGIKVFAPYTDLSKADIARHGAALGLDYSETYSCYKGGEKHCGTCTERRQALKEAGIDDPTEYLAE